MKSREENKIIREELFSMGYDSSYISYYNDKGKTSRRRIFKLAGRRPTKAAILSLIKALKKRNVQGWDLWEGSSFMYSMVGLVKYEKVDLS